MDELSCGDLGCISEYECGRKTYLENYAYVAVLSNEWICNQGRKRQSEDECLYQWRSKWRWAQYTVCGHPPDVSSTVLSPYAMHNIGIALGLEAMVDAIIITDELDGIEYRKPCGKAFRLI